MTRESLPWFRVDPETVLAEDAVAAMEPAGFGLYWKVAFRVWRAGSLPTDETQLRAICRGWFTNWDVDWPQVRAAMVEVEGRLTIAWIEEERARGTRILAVQRSNGNLGGRPPKPKRNPRVSHGKPTAKPGQTDGQPVVSPSLSSSDSSSLTPEKTVSTGNPKAAAKKPRTVGSGDHPQLMDHWWQEWQRTRGTPYAFQTKHGVAASKILKLPGVTLQEARRRVTRLLEHSDPWMAENASLCLVESRWNELGVGPRRVNGEEDPLRRAAFEELQRPRATANGKP